MTVRSIQKRGWCLLLSFCCLTSACGTAPDWLLAVLVDPSRKPRNRTNMEDHSKAFRFNGGLYVCFTTFFG